MATMFSGHTIADFHLRSSPPTTMVAGKWHYSENGRRQEGVQMYEFGLMAFEGTRNGSV
ncbi:uncharacterized protein G2W53_004083 [Senna tora]|uniref:Uncharacterized protein n=1 Tax=Senna tora TaxID=362788 RepID=A0A835CJ09_9FABA|nr:uncharacterized protein G2W53_004083 [Senna tora]